ncbi:hypothetical protein ES319_D10G062100v1 [Gossypium barbadense]|uniref:Uncharacterized protein n=2 Tax=Gossypium TaxID=3633 RepID=A0A5J5PM82_GOSBA|nr:hypothetical protein ES319_D10G062100v1 [Gossypium barbadense]KAB2007896.1 hypothetical protein ES319_D10G062100v1 [Gossypium barbadense]TYG49060.1 hypothetical protein ES288_D10G064600v1 [Gossypium darwinii]
MMRQPSASSTTLNSEYHHPGAPPPQMPPYDAHGDNFTAKRMRKLTQMRAVDYTSTVVRYMQWFCRFECHSGIHGTGQHCRFECFNFFML